MVTVVNAAASVAAALPILAECNSAGRTDWKSVFRRNLRAT